MPHRVRSTLTGRSSRQWQIGGQEVMLPLYFHTNTEMALYFAKDLLSDEGRALHV